tara:strand:+ start:445 stop:1095 length:651 start_codon:yes stop_codon:yes gene_type:complete
MGGVLELDEFLESQSKRVHKSHKKLARVVREAYPIGVPALIMKSSTDRLGASAGYAFHLGTPDDILRRIASWLITNSKSNQDVLWRLMRELWSRHGREDVALSALLLANLDHRAAGTDPWGLLSSLINSKEPADALLLSIEEVLRAGHGGPSNEQYRSWCSGSKVQTHLALISAFASQNSGLEIPPQIISLLLNVDVPDGDSLLGRIRDRFSELEP